MIFEPVIQRTKRFSKPTICLNRPYLLHRTYLRNTMKSRLLVLALLLFTLDATAQDILKAGRTVEGVLEPTSKVTYSFDTQKDFYVFGYVDQISVDVVVRVLDPEGKQVGEYDSPARGPEPFQFTPEVSGRYTIEVSPFEGGEGTYAVLLVANEAKASDPKKLIAQLMTPFSGDDEPGAVVSVLKNGKVLYAKGFGMSNLTYDIPMDENTGMSIASVSKQFTGMAVMLMVNEGKMDLDADIRTYLPDLKDFGTPITVRNMLNHTTGYREILNFMPMAGRTSAETMRTDEPMHIVNRQPVLQNHPGSVYNYNNTTFMLLARAVEKVSGEDWKTFMESRIFQPLGMTNTTVKVEMGQVIPNSSQGYARGKNGGYRYVMDFPEAYGASGVNTTALDITKWMLNYRDAKVGGRSAIDALTTRGILTTGDTTGYALGLGVTTWRGQRLWTHTGGEVSHRTWFGYFPDIDAGLFISSANPAYSNGMWTDIAGAWFAEYLQPEEEQVEPTPDASDVPTAEQLKAIAGRYQFIGAPLQIEYTLENGTMYAQATGQPRFEVSPTSDSTFTFVGVPASVTFHYEADGSVKRATHHQGQDAPMERIEETEMSDEVLAGYEGRYISEELETMYTLKVEDGRLMAHHRWVGPFPVTHVDGDTFTAGAWFLGQLFFDRSPDGSVSGFSAGGGRTHGVWFRKME